MENISNLINKQIEQVFENEGLDKEFAKCEVSKKSNLAEYQINSALALSKIVGKNPLDIAQIIADGLSSNFCFTKVEVAKPGFVNLFLNESFLQKYLYDMLKDENIGIEKENPPKKIVVDYGGANVAKPLHIGHLRSAVIGECIKRMLIRKGNNVISDIHLGDFGLQMGLTILELIEEGIENSFSLSDLENAYPLASKKAKAVLEDGSLENPEFAKKAHEITRLLQEEKEPYFSIWKRIVDVSVKDLKRNYDALNVYFDLWNGEACVNKYIPNLIRSLIDNNIAKESDGALIIDVQNEDDKKEIPPCIIKKSDGAVLYATTDLATIIDRELNIKPDEYIYITDIRQSLHFVQVFRAAKIAKLLPEETKLIHIGFGTMNGKDGKPFKTRDGGVLRLETLLKDVSEKAKEKIRENENNFENETNEDIASKVALAALKYGDLSNIAQKDYVFDIDKFVSFEGNTGPYILYTIVRINSILSKLGLNDKDIQQVANVVETDEVTKNLELILARYNEEFDVSYKELAPHKLCAYIYNLSNAFNSFYHGHIILKEENENVKKHYINLAILTRRILLDVIQVLGFDSPNKM